MHFPLAEETPQIEHPVTDPAGNNLFLVRLHRPTSTLPGPPSLSEGEDQPIECVSMVTLDQQEVLATCSVHLGLGGKHVCRILDSNGDPCGVLAEDLGAPKFQNDLSPKDGRGDGINVLNIKGDPRSLKLSMQQPDQEVVAQCEPGQPPPGQDQAYHKISCKGLLDIGVSVLLTLGADRIVAHDPRRSEVGRRYRFTYMYIAPRGLDIL
jgi:hypothetical protein